MAKTKLIPGFRFHPTDVELLKYYLKRKVMGKKFCGDAIAEVDIYKYAPWDLPDKSCLKTGDLEWYFFCPRGKKYASGARMNRATEVGYWKATGRDRAVQCNNETAGMVKTLVFHIGKAPRGDRTDWVMHEYRLEDKELADKGIPQDSYVICKVFQKEGPGPRNGAQYGRPFNEEDWDDDEVEMPVATLPAPVSMLTSTGSTTSCLSGPMPSPGPAGNPAVNNENDNDILSILDFFEEDNFFEGLEDLDNWAASDGFSSGQNAEYGTELTASTCDIDIAGSVDLEFVELTDLDSVVPADCTTRKVGVKDK